MALVYCVCASKTAITYKMILERLKADQPNFAPKQINIDFELATNNAAKEVFLNAKIQTAISTKSVRKIPYI